MDDTLTVQHEHQDLVGATIYPFRLLPSILGSANFCYNNWGGLLFRILGIEWGAE